MLKFVILIDNEKMKNIDSQENKSVVWCVLKKEARYLKALKIL